VTPNPIPVTAQPGTTFNDVLTVTTTVPGDGPSHAVQLEMTAAGVVLWAAYTTIPLSSNSLTHFFLGNRGNLTANVNTAQTVNGGAPGKFQLPNGFAVPPFGTNSVQVSFANGSGATTGMGTFTVPASTPTCYPPDNLAGAAWANGTLTLTLSEPSYPMLRDGAQPPASWSGQPIVPCAALGVGATPEMFPFLVTSTVAQATWSATITGPDSSFFSVSPSSGTVGTLPGPPTEVATLTAVGLSSTSGLTREQVAFGLNALVHFTLNNHNGMPNEDYYFPINEVPIGSFLAWSVSSVSVPEGSLAGATLYNWNRATAGATLTSTSEFPLQAGPNPQIGQPMSLLLSNHNGNVGDMGTVSIAVQSGTPTCGAVPAPLAVKLAAP
jgi:hypothetical protein